MRGTERFVLNIEGNAYISITLLSSIKTSTVEKLQNGLLTGQEILTYGQTCGRLWVALEAGGKAKEG